MKITTPLWILTLLGVLSFTSNIYAQAAEGDSVIKDGSMVSLEYTLSDEKGKVIESNKGKQPLSYTQGHGQIIPGLEKELLGMKVGGTKSVRVKPEDAYGPVNPKAYQEVPKTNVPPEALKVGATLVAKNRQGQGIPVRVHEIKEKTVVMDFNHPLAGKTLSFNVKVLDIKAAETKSSETKSPGTK
ncbi:MAG: peptidylprolyl isomerase [Deltaproteobacteria bacterium]|nr:peptidylprolyl isomerase [Deltaproteobacteria bacterium]